jgi:hypothetical protein
LAKNIDGQPVAQTYMPYRPAEIYLQYYYTANNPNPVGKKIDLDFAGDGSEYSNIHRKYHSKFRNIIKRIGYYDFNLIDSDR